MSRLGNLEPGSIVLLGATICAVLDNSYTGEVRVLDATGSVIRARGDESVEVVAGFPEAMLAAIRSRTPHTAPQTAAAA